MSDVALEFDSVWKKFKKGEMYDSLRDLIPALTRSLLSRNSRDSLQQKEFWALQDVSFQIHRGEAFGVIGPNGAGKSTTLKLLSKILQPNRGKIHVKGRISALIEVGAGFHPDLTGRENIYLNGSILGMNRQEIAKKFDEIVEFAGIADFIDTPVKRYSSGMYARLGFSVAAHVNPEILLVDEVLSVGDMQFQQKCLQRMQSIVRAGTTVIFVSHNLQAVNMLCSRALLLQAGKIAKLGSTADAINAYLYSPSKSTAKFTTSIHDVLFCDERDQAKTNFGPGDKARLRLTVNATEPLEQCILGFIIHRATDGLPVCDYNLSLAEAGPFRADASGAISLAVDVSLNLLRGAYVVSLHVFHSPTARFLCRADRMASFYVEETASWEGVCHLSPVVRTAQEVPL